MHCYVVLLCCLIHKEKCTQCCFALMRVQMCSDQAGDNMYCLPAESGINGG